MGDITQEQFPVMLRKFTWDVVPCGEVLDYLRVLSLVLPSEEGAEIEHRDSHRRVDLQKPVQQRIMVYSAMTARVLAALALRLAQGPEPDEIVNTVTGQFTQTIHVAASAIVAELLDSGHLMLGPSAVKALVPGV